MFVYSVLSSVLSPFQTWLLIKHYFRAVLWGKYYHCSVYIWEIEELRNLPKVTKLAKDRVEIQTQICLTPNPKACLLSQCTAEYSEFFMYNTSSSQTTYQPFFSKWPPLIKQIISFTNDFLKQRLDIISNNFESWTNNAQNPISTESLSFHKMYLSQYSDNLCEWLRHGAFRNLP